LVHASGAFCPLRVGFFPGYQGRHGILHALFFGSQVEQHVWVGYSNGTILIYDIAQKKKEKESANAYSVKKKESPYPIIAQLKEHSGGVYALKLGPGRTRVFSCSNDFTVRSWDPKRLTKLNVFSGHINFVRDICIVDLNLCTASEDHTVRVFRLPDAIQVYETARETDHVLHGHTGGVWSVIDVWGELWSAGEDATVKIWDLTPGVTSPLRHVLKAHRSTITSLLHCETVVYSCSQDKMVVLWDPVSRAALHKVSEHTGGVAQVLAVGASELVWSFGTNMRKIRSYHGYIMMAMMRLRVPIRQVARRIRACACGAFREASGATLLKLWSPT
jgi:WD40 repeat protein